MSADDSSKDDGNGDDGNNDPDYEDDDEADDDDVLMDATLLTPRLLDSPARHISNRNPCVDLHYRRPTSKMERLPIQFRYSQTAAIPRDAVWTYESSTPESMTAPSDTILSDTATILSLDLFMKLKNCCSLFILLDCSLPSCLNCFLTRHFSRR
jgi:hypothetical protein